MLTLPLATHRWGVRVRPVRWSLNGTGWDGDHGPTGSLPVTPVFADPCQTGQSARQVTWLYFKCPKIPSFSQGRLGEVGVTSALCLEIFS